MIDLPMTMNLPLTPEQQHFIQQELAIGHYASAADLLADALQLLAQRRQNMTRPKLSLVQAAEQMKSLYEPGNELAQWTDENPEDFQDYQSYA